MHNLVKWIFEQISNVQWIMYRTTPCDQYHHRFVEFSCTFFITWKFTVSEKREGECVWGWKHPAKKRPNLFWNLVFVSVLVLVFVLLLAVRSIATSNLLSMFYSIYVGWGRDTVLFRFLFVLLARWSLSCVKQNIHCTLWKYHHCMQRFFHFQFPPYCSSISAVTENGFFSTTFLSQVCVSVYVNVCYSLAPIGNCSLWAAFISHCSNIFLFSFMLLLSLSFFLSYFSTRIEKHNFWVCGRCVLFCSQAYCTLCCGYKW